MDGWIAILDQPLKPSFPSISSLRCSHYPKLRKGSEYYYLGIRMIMSSFRRRRFQGQLSTDDSEIHVVQNLNALFTPILVIVLDVSWLSLSLSLVHSLS